ncbi:MAG: NAD(P)H-dependent oxidoreductase [Spongiibacteraceae bacterium]
MKNLLVVYHSQSGATAQLAQAVRQGALQENNVDVRVWRAMEAGTRDLLWADAVIFGSPENFGYLSGGLTDFLARTFYPAQPHQLSLPYAAFISAGNDGSGAVRMLERIVAGYPLKKIAEPVIVKGLPTTAGLQRCEELGLTMAAGIAMGLF